VLGAVALCGALHSPASDDTQTGPQRFHIGTAATAEEIATRNIDIMPDGEGLPEGSGSVAEGRKVYERACLQCHGVEGQGGSVAALAGGRAVAPTAMAADRAITHTIGNYWPWATTLFDYTRRAMPYDRPGSLSDDEVYAVTAYMLYLNELVDSDTRLDAASLPRISMPARPFFRPDGRSAGIRP
jgi:cytochrome c